MTTGCMLISRPRANFSLAIGDAKILLDIHDRSTQRKAGRPKRELEVLKRSALILTVTAWESFIENTLEAQSEILLKRTTDPAEISAIFNSIAREWLDRGRNGSTKPPDLLNWTGDKWKDVIRKSVKNSLASFNTPNSENVARVFKRYLNIDIAKSWSWQRVSSRDAQCMLDTLIGLRGKAVHKGKCLDVSPEHLNIRRGTVVNALNLVGRLVDATDCALGVEPRSLRINA